MMHGTNSTTPTDVPQQITPDATALFGTVGAQSQIDIYFGSLLALASYANYAGVIAALDNRESTPALVQAAFETALFELGAEFSAEEVG